LGLAASIAIKPDGHRVNIKNQREESRPNLCGGYSMFTRQNVARLLLAGLLLALLAVPILGAAMHNGVAANDTPHSTLLYHVSPTDSAGTAIACVPGDPGGGQGGGC
jgi:hypothetical protein